VTKFNLRRKRGDARREDMTKHTREEQNPSSQDRFVEAMLVEAAP